MRSLGYTLILFGILSAVVIMIYNTTLGWSGLAGSIIGVITGIGFLNPADDGCRREHPAVTNNCGGCNRY